MINLKPYAKEHSSQPVAVFGLGLSGLSAVKALIEAGFSVTAGDDKQENCQKAKDLGASIKDLSSIDLSDFHFLVLAPGVPYAFEPHPVVLNAQKHNLEIIGDIELLDRSDHGKKTIGITGTNGKSTTTALMTHVLKECGLKAEMAGNIGVPVCDLNIDDLDIIVLEISSFQLDLCPRYRPDISILLNITPDHIDRHGSLLNYIEAKEIILEGEGIGIVGIDGDYTQESFNKAFFKGKRKMIPISVKLEVTEGIFVHDNKLFENHGGKNTEVFEINNFETLKGSHNYQNIAAVYAVTNSLKINPDRVKESFSSFKGLTHRQYKIGQKDKVVFINDSKATNAEATARALASYKNIHWIVGGRAKEGGLNGLEIFKDKIIKAYLIGESSDEFAVWLKKNNFSFQKCKTLDKAVSQSYKEAKKNSEDSVVLLSPACASFDQYTSFEKRGEAFTEKVLSIIGSQ
jgi:UDP-N-acetylmuramoylalanine--D-glutamate ligase